MTDSRNQIENLHQRIEESDEISETDAELLMEFSREMELKQSEYSELRHRDLIGRCVRIIEESGCSLEKALEERKEAEEIVLWINRNYENEWTNADYRDALRVFAGNVTEGDVEEKPDTISWIPSGTSNSHDPRPDPADMLEWKDDVKPMIEEARNPRDKALIAVAFDTGARSGELQDPTVGDVSDHQYGLQLRVDGRRGERSVPLIPSVPYLNRWLNEHPAPDDPDAPLWSKLDEPESISYRSFNNAFKDAADRAGVTKPATPTNFRKSNATYLARQDMPQAFIEDRQGRKRGSEATAHYVAKFGGEVDDKYAQLHGKEVEDDDPELHAPIECPRCHRETPADEAFCVWCRQALEHDAVREIEETEEEQRRNLLKIAQEYPDLLESMEEMEPLIEALGGNADLIDAAASFTEAVE
ncbi:hypothetical protein JCM18237_05380 [Halorubrum luteum]